MDNKEKTYVKAAIAVAVIAVIWLIMRGRSNSTIIPPEGLNSFQQPFFWTNPGIADNKGTLNGGPTFNATNTINVNTGQIAGLSRSHIPLFGLVGMTAVGA